MDEEGFMKKLKVTAILAFRNERQLLEGCLARLGWVDQLILIDMASEDGSREVAKRYTQEIYDWPAEPIADPARAWAVQFARHEWLLSVDPDEHYPQELVEEIEKVLKDGRKDVGGIRLPMRYYLKGKVLKGTVWGGERISKLGLVHRDRGGFLPVCNRITFVKPGYETVVLGNTQENHIRHYWCDSYRELMRKHFQRYPAKDAMRLWDDGVRWSWKLGVVGPVGEMYRCLRDYDGWRDGFRGWILSAIFGVYHFLIAMELLKLQRRLGQGVRQAQPRQEEGKKNAEVDVSSRQAA